MEPNGPTPRAPSFLQVQTATERAEDYAAVEAEVRRLHLYQEPEIIATPIVAGSASYLAWIAGQTARE